jgi:hypothetical protein
MVRCLSWYPGMPCQITANQWTQAGVVNGADGRMHSVIGAYLLVELDDVPKGCLQVDGLPKGVVPVERISRQVPLMQRDGRTLPAMAQWKQYPVVQRFAVTGYKTQSKTYSKIVVSPNWARAPGEWLFVVISRVESIAGLFFTEQIEASTFSRCKVSPGVEKEMDRLRRIRQQTLAQFAASDTDVPKPARKRKRKKAQAKAQESIAP